MQSYPILFFVLFFSVQSTNGFLLYPPYTTDSVLKPAQKQGERCQRRPQSVPAPMISFGGVGGETGKDDSSPSAALPRDVKEAVTKCREAVQEALKRRLSRMDIEMPVGTKFGVEKNSKKQKQKAGGPTQDVLDTSDRELARLFVDMFQPVGGQNICVAFQDKELADLAKKRWRGDPTATCRILAMNRRSSARSGGRGGSKKQKPKPMGFAAKLAAEIEDDAGAGGTFQLPQGTEVALFVAPGPKELVVIEKICKQVGMGTLVVLLNARLSRISNFGTTDAENLFTSDFEQVFCLAAAPQAAAPDCLLYRAFPRGWVLARKPKVGQPKAILSQALRPTETECREAYKNLEVGEFEKGVENALENVAGWFR